jgi:hypothetical protein
MFFANYKKDIALVKVDAESSPVCQKGKYVVIDFV